jgi:hypothetical protein
MKKRKIALLAMLSSEGEAGSLKLVIMGILPVVVVGCGW